MLARSATRLWPYLLLLSAFAIRLNALAFQSLWRDEVDAIRFALAPLTDLIKTFTQPGFNGPLYFLLLRDWIGVAGQSEWAIRYLSLICGVVGVALIYALGTRLFNRPIGLIAALLLAVSGYHVWYSQEAKMYTLITCLALAAIYSLRRAVEGGHWRWWVSLVICTSFAVYAHILAALLIPVEIALFVLWWPHSQHRVIPAFIALACLTLPYLPLAIWQLPLITQPAETGFGRFSFGEMLNILNSAYTRGILSSLPDIASWISGAAGATLAAFGLLTYARYKLNRAGVVTTSLVLLAWLAVPFLAIFIVSLSRPLFTDRYLIWIMPAYYLLVAQGIDALWRWFKPLAVVGLIILVAANSIGVWTQATTPYKSDFRSAAQFIDQRRQPDEAIVFQIPYVQYTFDYYFQQPYQPILGPYTNHLTATGYLESDEAIQAKLSAEFADDTSVWLVASEVAMWDQRDLLQGWLNAHGRVTDQATYAQVHVVRYQLK